MRPYRANLIVLLLLTIGVLPATAQTAAELSKIAASQGAAAALFFNPMTDKVPELGAAVSSYQDNKECTVRGGLPHFMARLEKKAPVVIGYIGGSITQGNTGYRPQLSKWIQQQYPHVKMRWLNAGVSGTGTDLAACRIQEQLLRHQPHLVFVEFAVNGAYQPGMEGIIRQIIRNNPETDICLVYTLLNGQTKIYQQGKVPENITGLEAIAEHYQLPSVHMGMQAAKLEQEGALVWKGDPKAADGKIVFSTDGIHPLMEGGNFYAAAVARGIKKINTTGNSAAHLLPNPLIPDNWEDAGMYAPEEVADFSGEWTRLTTKDEAKIKGFNSWFPTIMKAATPGASLSFRFSGTMFGLFDIGGPEVGQLSIEVDGKPVVLEEISSKGFHLYKAVPAGGQSTLNRFNRYCNNRYRGQYDMIAVGPGEHTIVIRLAPDKADKAGTLGEGQQQDISQHPEKYDQTVLYLGKILLRGKPLKAAAAANASKAPAANLSQQQKWEQKVRNYERQDSLNPPGKKIILFTGSSTIENWKSLQQDFPGRNVLNRGISGTKTSDLLAYADRVIKPYKAAQIFLYEGDNDIGYKLTPEQILEQFTKLFEKTRELHPKANIVFISIKPSPRRLKDSVAIQRSNALIQDYLRGQKNAGYADVYTAMLGPDGGLPPAYYREDGLHLTPEGYKVWTAVIGRHLKK
ncbi:MAG: SGNH/GDSL hydrolase family protein [Candidatus Pseudobacter hemicellulosilyticus]|uniref:SGNH/GDSL hydrolase family protein n=1 Tax=Candidatus Pseudobacter hemicellulosilyticus TaxID=3121375 RepID=A0AAJ5WW39_9BACT|nr:MAG: SGNH/GDSL hydrolase family protein [Pseudobacter sp.]